MYQPEVRTTAPFPTTQDVANNPTNSQINQAAVPQELLKSKALEVVKRRYNNSRMMSMLDYTRFARYYRLFRNKQTVKNYLGLANLFVPEP